MIKALYRLRDDGDGDFVAAFSDEELGKLMIGSLIHLIMGSGKPEQEFTIKEFPDPNMPDVYEL